MNKTTKARPLPIAAAFAHRERDFSPHHSLRSEIAKKMKCDRFYFNAAGSENRRAQFPVGFILKSAINPLIWEE